MSKGDNTPGLSKLAGVIKDLAVKQVPTDLILDFGTIQADGSLLTNTYPLPIPLKDYQVCRHLRAIPDKDQWTTKKAGTHTHPGGDGGSAGEHVHYFQPNWPLKIGDRVLVAWVQNDAVVIDVIVSAASAL